MILKAVLFGQKTHPYKCWKMRKVIMVTEINIKGVIHLNFSISLVHRWIGLPGLRVLCLWWILGNFCCPEERLLSHPFLAHCQKHMGKTGTQLWVLYNRWLHAASEPEPWSMEQTRSMQMPLTRVEVGVMYPHLFWIYLNVLNHQHINGLHKVMFIKYSVPDLELINFLGSVSLYPYYGTVQRYFSLNEQ